MLGYASSSQEDLHVRHSHMKTPYLPYVTWKFYTMAIAGIESFNAAHFAFCSPPEGE